MHSPSSFQEPVYSAAVQPSAVKPASRRLPAPCWTDAETVALIDCYREKWYSLRRGNLRAPDWQEVADGVADRCPLTIPAKTSIQCRHKMEKLRKRYRAEIQRLGSNRREYGSPSSWIHFKLMDDMELGLDSSDVNLNNRYDAVADQEDDEEEDDMVLYAKGRRSQALIGNGDGNGVRIRIPNFETMTSPQVYRNNRLLDDLPPNMNPGYASGRSGGLGKGVRNGGLKRKNDGDGDGEDVMNEMVAAIRKLGDGFVKMERMKMEMARELESMRMKAEMRQTEMVIETHQKLWDSFSKSVLEKKKKKMKRMATEE